MSNKIEYQDNIVQINGQVLNLTSIQDVRVVDSTRPKQPNWRRPLTSVSWIATVVLGVLKGLNTFTGTAGFLNMLFLVIALGASLLLAYTYFPWTAKNELANLAIQVRINSQYKNILYSTNQAYVDDIAVTLKRHIEAAQYHK